MDYAGSQTEVYLNNAFNAEARAYVLYRLYAEEARREGDFTAGQLFDNTARNELAHARLWFELLHDGMPGTEENLLTAAESERFETTQMYNLYADAARAEGFDSAAALFDLVAATEKTHEQAYEKRRGELLNGTERRRPQPADWICQNCGHHHQGEAAPEICPVCRLGSGYFRAAEG